MAKKPILTDDELDAGFPVPPVPPTPRSGSATRPLDTPEPPSATRPLDVPSADPIPSSETSGRDASGHARPKTRIHGYGGTARDDADNTVTDDVGINASIEAPVVGWLVVTAGPGRGAFVGLVAGMNAIGRGDANAVQIDFGDASISRDAHAYVIYDDEARAFHVSHGGKTNLVRLNDAPVLAAEALSHGDTLRIGATSLRFVALCGADFDWNGA